MRVPWSAYAHLVQRRFRWIIVVAGLGTIALALGLPSLRFSSSQDTMIPSGSSILLENNRYQRQFGGDPMIVLFEGDVRTLLDGHNQRELARLEAALTRETSVHSVMSPLTSLRFATDQIPIAGDLALRALARDQESAAENARRQAAARGASLAEQDAAAEAARVEVARKFDASHAADATRLAAAGPPSLDNPRFVDFLVFDEHARIRPTFTGVFPDARHALFVVRLAGNLTVDDIGTEGERIVRLTEARDFDGVRVLPTGSPLLLKEINDGMRTDMTRMGAIAAGVMVLVLFVVVRARWRLLALATTVLGIVWAFGLLGYLGIPLTMVTISGLPILIGLGVDFAVQTHSRYEEEVARRGEWREGLVEMFGRLGPALGIAVVAAVAGFVALRLSRVPMIRDFGVMLAVGASASFVAALFVVPAVLAWRDSAHSRRLRLRERVGIERAVRLLARLARGHAALLLAFVVAVSAFGIYAQQHTTVQSDPERFVPPDSPVLTDLLRIRDVASSSGDFGVMIVADDVMRADVLSWMYRFETRELRAHPRQLFRSSSVASIVSTATGGEPTPEDVQAIMAVAPDAITKTFISRDRQRAHVIFAIGPVSLQQRKELIASIRADLRTSLRPPSGVRVVISGLAVVGIAAFDALSANRWQMAGVALLAVFVWLAIAFRRRPLRAVLALVPVIAALGLSWAAVFLFGVEVNSLTALSSPLVIAVCTEFSVLVMERYVEERAGGKDPDDATDTAALHIGRAFTASGLATAGGFGVLALSGFPLLSNFGTVIALNVVAALLCSLVVLPPLLRAADAWLIDRSRVPGDGGRLRIRPLVGDAEPTKVPVPRG